jgi:hypothetical protein
MSTANASMISHATVPNAQAISNRTHVTWNARAKAKPCGIVTRMLQLWLTSKYVMASTTGSQMGDMAKTA